MPVVMRIPRALSFALVAAACGPDQDVRTPVVQVAVDGIVVSHVPDPLQPASDVSLAALLDWQAPIAGRLTSPFGPRALDDSFHDAVDVAAPIGTPVTAPADLRIRTIAYQARAGRHVVADVLNEEGVVQWRLTFAHLSQVAVFEGDRIKRGQTIGLIGLSGSASGAHLHFRVEAVQDGARIAIDPLTVIPSLGI